MLSVKELIKTKDTKIINRKISIYNFLNDTNYSLNDLGLFEYNGYLNYYGTPFNIINFSKLKKYKEDYLKVREWFFDILDNKCEIVEKTLRNITDIYIKKNYCYKGELILDLNLERSAIWVFYSDLLVELKKENIINSTNFIMKNILVNLVKEYFNTKIDPNLMWEDFSKFH